MGLPIQLLPRAGPALVVGGGRVAERRVRNLLAAGFAVRVVSPKIGPSIDSVDKQERVEILQREFEPGDIEGHSLVFACTDKRAVNRKVGELARDMGVPVVVCDSQPESTFFAPAVHRDGNLTVAVSTGGASPQLAASLCDHIAEMLGAGWNEKISAARLRREQGVAAEPEREAQEGEKEGERG